MFAAQKAKMFLAIAASLALIILLFSPADVPLYTMLIFPCPDPRTPNVDAKFGFLPSFNATKKDIAIRCSNGRRIRGWFVELPNSKRVFLFSHGKGNNVYGSVGIVPLLLSCGGSVLLYDYQGFGDSEGKISVDGACDDATAVYDYLIEKEHRTAKDIIAFGGSFGCGVSGQLAARRQLAAVILQSGFTSLIRAGRDRYFWLRCYPDWIFPRAMRMDTLAVFSKPHPPLLIIHGKRDPVLPYKNAEDLFAQAIEPKELYTIPNGGHCSYGTKSEFVSEIKNFLEKNSI